MTDGHPLAAASIGMVIFVLGVALGSATYQRHHRVADEIGNWVHADGIVSDIVTAPTGGQPAALVGFGLPDGARVRFLVRGPAYVKEQHVPVIYPPGNPRGARLAASGYDWRLWFASMASLLMMAFGLRVTWYARQIDRRTRA
jgi:hypothetical protein